MVSLATISAYEDIEAVATKMGVERMEDFRRDLACLIAYHSCRGGSFASAYAYGDLMACFGIDPWGLSAKFIARHPILAFQIWRADRKRKAERAAP